MTHERGIEWCARVEAALSDGRFLEDPAAWRSHVEGCETCRTRVEGYFEALKQFRGQRDRAPIVATSPDGSDRMIDAAFRHYHRRQRLAALGLGAGIVALVAGILILTLPRSPEPREAHVDYARRLYERVYPPGRSIDGALLRDDASLRAEYLRALDHPSSLVRRTALSSLLDSGVQLEPERLAKILEGWQEDLEAPVEVAEVGEGTRRFAEALESRRVATLLATLRGVGVLVAQGGRGVPPALVVPHLSHADPHVRRAAILALAHDPAYVPGPEMTRLLRADPAEEVRVDAADALVRRLGSAGAEAVVEHLSASSDWAVETPMVPALGNHPVGLPFARERLASAGTPTRVALAHALTVLRSGEKGVPVELLARALEAGDAETHVALAMLVGEADWAAYRDDLQSGWRTLPDTPNRTVMGLTLVHWDLLGSSEGRWTLAMEICETHATLPFRRHIERLATSSTPDIRERASRLLRRLVDR